VALAPCAREHYHVQLLVHYPSQVEQLGLIHRNSKDQFTAKVPATSLHAGAIMRP